MISLEDEEENSEAELEANDAVTNDDDEDFKTKKLMGRKKIMKLKE